MAMIPIALQLLPLIPDLVSNVIKLVNAVRHDPATPEEAKADLDAVAVRLEEVKAQVAVVKLPSE